MMAAVFAMCGNDGCSVCVRMAEFVFPCGSPTVTCTVIEGFEVAHDVAVVVG